MRRLSLVLAGCMAAALGLLNGCSGGSSTTPRAYAPGASVASQTRRAPSFKRFYACPAKGDIEYISDYHNSVINVYAGKFSGQGPCGQIVDYADLGSPTSLFVEASSHDLYVANAGDVLVFRRGETTPYNTYYDPSRQNVVDVTVAKDGIVIAANSHQAAGNEKGSISTWKVGPNGGTFIGNFPVADCVRGAYLTVQKYGNVYFAGIRESRGDSVMWTSRCPNGVCRPFTLTGAQNVFPGGLRSGEGEDVLWADALGDELATYESFPYNVTFFSLPAGGGESFDLNRSRNRIFYANFVNNVTKGVEATLPPAYYTTDYNAASTLVGTVPFNENGLPGGVAVDPPGGL